MSAFSDLLLSCLENRVSLDQQQLLVLEKHYSLLVRWNRGLNLTSIRTQEEAIRRHYCESLFLGGHLASLAPVRTVADVGSGAGFPGFPLAVLNPHWRVTLVEAHQRKAVFLKESARELANLLVRPCRLSQLTETHDLIVSRAVHWFEIAADARDRATYVGLLAGGADLPEILGTHGWTWQDPELLPHGNQRYIVVGSRAGVSRETN